MSLGHTERPEELAQADVIILPGSKQTIDDLDWMERKGFSRVLLELNLKGSRIVGICGGFQMLGKEIADPYGTENNGIATLRAGLGLLEVRTILSKEKTTRQVSGTVLPGSSVTPKPFIGYEIHVGETEYIESAKPFSEIRRNGVCDYVLDGAINGDGASSEPTSTACSMTMNSVMPSSTPPEPHAASHPHSGSLLCSAKGRHGSTG